MAGHEVFDQEPVAQELHDLALHVEVAELREAGLIAECGAVDVEALDEVGGTEIVKPGLTPSQIHQRRGRQLHLLGQRLDRRKHLAYVGRELRIGEVIDPNWSRPRVSRHQPGTILQ